MIPGAPPASTRSNAEKKVFGLLEATRVDGSTCFHSLRLHRHPSKVSGEADFVIVSPLGVLVLEVKGGRVLQRAGGWVYIDGDDVEHPSSEGPFRQAEGAMYALRDRLRELVGRGGLEALPFGFAVVTPDCSIATNSVEWGPEIVLDHSRLRGLTDLTDELPKVFDHWRQERGVKASVRAADAELEAVVAACRPDFDRVPSLGARAQDIVEQMETATKEQYRILDTIGVLDRLVVTGGAGTGKTMMAAEAARRHAAADRTVLMTCHARTLAAWLRAQLPASVAVTSHGALAADTDRYDVLICDEAQDLMTEDGLDQLDLLVHGGLDEGRWMMVLDPQHQAGVTGSFDEDVYGLLLERSGTGKALPLTENLRNTSHIVTETTLMTGALSGRPRVAGGGPVIVEYATDATHEAALVRQWLKDLRREEVPAEHVTLLTPSGEEVIPQLPQADQRRLRRLGASGAAAWPVSETTYTSVSEFKGLENDVIVLAGLWGLEPREQANVIYVAMTRARVELRVVWPEDLRPILDDLRLRHVNLLGAAK